MKPEVFTALVGAIDKVVIDHADENLWVGDNHYLLIKQMAAAAALVFDANRDGQVFAERKGAYVRKT